MLVTGILVIIAASLLHCWYASNKAAAPSNCAIGFFGFGKLVLIISIALLLLGTGLVWAGGSFWIGVAAVALYFFVLPLAIMPWMQKIYVPMPKNKVSEAEWARVAGLNQHTTNRPASGEYDDPQVFADLAASYKFGIDGRAKDINQAVHWYREAAKYGHTESQIELLELHFYGEGIPQDYAEAAYWARQAAELGAPYAQLWLGRFYEDGDVIPQDYEKAAHWYRQAANVGFPNAKWRLGLLHETGRGVKVDLSEAYFWLSLAIHEWKITHIPIDASYSAKADEVGSILEESDRLAAENRMNLWIAEHPTKVL
jgi:hypothetical protein